MRIKRNALQINPVKRHPLEQVTNLNGLWGTMIDEDDVGIEQEWYKTPLVILKKTEVPGCLQRESISYTDGTYQGESQTVEYIYKSGWVGTTWYTQSFQGENLKEGERLWLNFGGVMPTAQVWVNGTFVGENHNPFIAFGFDISDLVKEGENHVVVRVSEEDRLFAYGYNCLGKWAGIYRGVELKKTGCAYIDAFRIIPDFDKKEVSFVTDVKGGNGMVSLTIKEWKSEREVAKATFAVNEGEQTLTLQMDNPRAWTIDDPFLYAVEAELDIDGIISDAKWDRFGFARLKAEDKHFVMDREKYFLRGTGDFNDNPITVSPDPDIDNWRKKMQALRDFGYNYVRNQSYLQTPEYLAAADELGVVIQNELGTLGAIAPKSPEHVYPWPQPNAENYQRMLEQWVLGVKQVMNHPSARMWAMSNELNGNFNTTEYPQMAWKCYRETKKLDPNTLVIWTDGGTNMEMPSDFINDCATGICCDQPNAAEQYDLPYIQHEYQWWVSYPDIRMAERFIGGIRPVCQTTAAMTAAKNGLAEYLVDFAIASQHQELVEAKGKMEAIRRNVPTLGGIDHFNAADVGTSGQGIMNCFYEPKLVDAKTWNQTNGDCVILCDLDFHTRNYTFGSNFRCEIGVSDYAHPSFTCGLIRWEIGAEDGTILADGEISYTPNPARYQKAGEINITLPQGEKPVAATLRVSMEDGGRVVDNAWELYLYPTYQKKISGVRVEKHGLRDWVETVDAEGTGEVVITDLITEELAEYIKNGGKVILATGEGLNRAFHPQGILGPARFGRYYFNMPANYPPFEDGQYGTLLLDSPLFGDFPIPKGDIHAGLEFYNILSLSPPMDTASLGLPKEGVAMRMIHSFYIGRSLTSLALYGYGKGSLVMCALDLNQKWPEAQCFLRNLVKALQDGATPQSILGEETMTKLKAPGIFTE